MDTVTKLFKVKPPQVFKSLFRPVNCANPELVVGVELETENCNPDAMYYGAGLDGAWNVDRDGSLRGVDRQGNPTSYEFISRPLPLGQLLPELQAFFNFTQFNEKNYTDRCSVHVHTNVTDFTQDMLASLGMVYTIMEDVLFQYVNHYKAPTKDGYCRDTNLYCIPWNQCRMNHKLVEYVFSPEQKVFARWQKYTALNLLPITTQGTVEWRHMHGTADMEKLTNWLNLIGSIMYYARRTPLDDVIKQVRTLNDTSAYRQFFTDVLRGYLDYDDNYASALSEGVINAKYSLLDWDRTKIPKPKEKKASTNLYTEFVAIDDLMNDPAPVRVVGAGLLQRNWVINGGAEVAQVPPTVRVNANPVRPGDARRREPVAPPAAPAPDTFQATFARMEEIRIRDQEQRLREQLDRMERNV